MLNLIIISLVSCAISLYAGYILRKHIAGKKLKDAESQAKLIIEQAKKESQDRRREADLEIRRAMKQRR